MIAADTTEGRRDDALADEAFDSDEVRGAILRGHDALPAIPNRRERAEPWPRDEGMRRIYRKRNRRERAAGEAKQDRRLATQYEDLGDVYLTVVRQGFGFIHVKKLAQMGCPIGAIRGCLGHRHDLASRPT